MASGGLGRGGLAEGGGGGGAGDGGGRVEFHEHNECTSSFSGGGGLFVSTDTPYLLFHLPAAFGQGGEEARKAIYALECVNVLGLNVGPYSVVTKQFDWGGGLRSVKSRGINSYFGLLIFSFFPMVCEQTKGLSAILVSRVSRSFRLEDGTTRGKVWNSS